MNMETHNKYFRDIAYNMDSSVSWPDPSKSAVGASSSSLSEQNKHATWNEWSADRRAEGPTGGLAHFLTASKSVYDARIEELISKCKHVKTFRDMVSQSG
jgi:hypothetical protein